MDISGPWKVAWSEVSMSSTRYADEYKIEAVRQVTDRGFKVADTEERDILEKAAAYSAQG